MVILRTVLMYLPVLQAGDLYEKVHRNDEALQCYKKGYAYRRGNVCCWCRYPLVTSLYRYT